RGSRVSSTAWPARFRRTRFAPSGGRPCSTICTSRSGERVAEGAPAAGAGVTFREALVVWTRVGLNSFGGPAGQIAVMHRIVVEEKRWVDEAHFLHALNYCMLLPGPEAQQLAIYLGWLLHGYP